MLAPPFPVRVASFIVASEGSLDMEMRRQVSDLFGRALGDLRVSVTDRCNLRCAYCMPEEEYAWLSREDILQFEEIATLCDVFAGLGVTKVRLTGGEPLLRRDLSTLVRMIAG